MDKENRIEKIFRERLYDFEYNLDDTGWIEISPGFLVVIGFTCGAGELLLLWP